MATKIGIDYSKIIIVIPEGARPASSWNAHPHLYYNSSNSKWGVVNLGSAADSIIADFIIVYSV